MTIFPKSPGFPQVSPLAAALLAKTILTRRSNGDAYAPDGVISPALYMTEVLDHSGVTDRYKLDTANPGLFDFSVDIVGSETLVDWITPQSRPGMTLYSGTFTVKVRAAKTAGADDVTIRAELYAVSGLNVATLLGSSAESANLDGVDTEYTLTVAGVNQAAAYSDRLMVRIVGSCSGLNGVTVAFTGGSGDPAYVTFPNCLTFDNAAIKEGGGGLIEHAHVTSDNTPAVGPELELWVFSKQPTQLYLDGALFQPSATDLQNLVGIFPLTTKITPNVAEGYGYVNLSAELNRVYRCDKRVLYGVLLTRNAYDPEPREELTVDLHLLRDAEIA